MLSNLPRVETVIDPDITQAKTLPTKYYLDAKYFELAKEKIFTSSWQFITDTDNLKEPGRVVPHTLLKGYLNEPILLTRDSKGAINCLSNVCTHRGTVLIESACNAQQMRCRYHGRRFGLDGKFISAPGFEDACNFPSASDDLSQISTAQFGKLIFASLDPKIDFEELIGNMRSRLNWMSLDDFVFDSMQACVYDVRANWALYIDNYLEGLHLPYVHPGLSASVDINGYRTELYRYSNLQIGPAQDAAGAFHLPEGSPDFGENIAAYYYWLFPNTMIYFYPWGLSVVIAEPLAADYTRVRYLPYVYDRSRMKGYAIEEVKQTDLEDIAIVEQVQQGIRSSFYKKGRYAPRWENGVHQFHTLLAEKLGD